MAMTSIGAAFAQNGLLSVYHARAPSAENRKRGRHLIEGNLGIAEIDKRPE